MMKDNFPPMANDSRHRRRPLSGLIQVSSKNPYCPFDNDGDDPIVDTPISPSTAESLPVSDDHVALQLDLKDQLPLPPSLCGWDSFHQQVKFFGDTSRDVGDDDLTVSSEASSLACFAQLFPKAHDSPPSFVPHFAPLLDIQTTRSTGHPDWNDDVPQRRLSLSETKNEQKSKKKENASKRQNKECVENQRKSLPTRFKKSTRSTSSSLAKSRASAVAADWYPILEGAGSQFTNLAFAPTRIIQNLEEAAVAHRLMSKLQNHERGTETLHPKALLKFFLTSQSPPPERITLGKNGLCGPEKVLNLDLSNLSLTSTASCSMQTESHDMDEDELVFLDFDGCNRSSCN